MKFSRDKRITSMVMTSIVAYLIGIVILFVLAIINIVRDPEIIKAVAFGVAGLVFLFLVFRHIRMYCSAKKAYLEVVGDKVCGTYNKAPKNKSNQTFEIDRSEIVNIAEGELSLNSRSPFPVPVINTKHESYFCFGIGEFDKIRRELDPTAKGDQSSEE